MPKKEKDLLVEGRAQLIEASCVGGGGVVEFGQAVHPLQNHLQHVTDLPQHTTWLHTPQHWVERQTSKDRSEMKEKQNIEEEYITSLQFNQYKNIYIYRT